MRTAKYTLLNPIANGDCTVVCLSIILGLHGRLPEFLSPAEFRKKFFEDIQNFKSELNEVTRKTLVYIYHSYASPDSSLVKRMREFQESTDIKHMSDIDLWIHSLCKQYAFFHEADMFLVCVIYKMDIRMLIWDTTYASLRSLVGEIVNLIPGLAANRGFLNTEFYLVPCHPKKYFEDTNAAVARHNMLAIPTKFEDTSFPDSKSLARLAKACVNSMYPEKTSDVIHQAISGTEMDLQSQMTSFIFNGTVIGPSFSRDNSGVQDVFDIQELAAVTQSTNARPGDRSCALGPTGTGTYPYSY